MPRAPPLHTEVDQEDDDEGGVRKRNRGVGRKAMVFMSRLLTVMRLVHKVGGWKSWSAVCCTGL